MRSKGNSPITLVILVFLIVIFGYGALNYSGFCFREMRYLSDEEKIKLALDSIIREQNGFEKVGNIIDANMEKRVLEIIPYKSAEAFISENPNWCQQLVPRDGYFGDDPGPTFSDRVFGLYSYGVRVSYLEKRIETPINKDGSKGKRLRGDIHRHGLLSFGNCGRPCDTCGD